MSHNIIVEFEVWTECQHDVILGMSWLNVMDALIAYKHEEVHGRFFDGKSFKINGKRYQISIGCCSVISEETNVSLRLYVDYGECYLVSGEQ